jgi:hypothetical protein
MTEEIESPDGEVSQSPLPSLPRRLGMVVLSPIALFERLKQDPRIVGPLILGAVLVGVGAAVIPVEAWEEMLREQMLDAGQDLGDGFTMAARVSWVFSIFGPLVFWPLMAVITAGLYGAVFLFGFGYEGSYRKLLSVTAHALLVAALGMLLLGPVRAMTGDPSLTLSVGSLLFFFEEGYLARFLGLLDLFNLWVYILIGAGAAVVDGTRSRTEGAVVAVAAAMLISAVIAAFTG